VSNCATINHLVNSIKAGANSYGTQIEVIPMGCGRSAPEWLRRSRVRIFFSESLGSNANTRIQQLQRLILTN
jgi:hypothetical protein